MRIAKYALVVILFSLLLSGCGKNVTLYKQAKKLYEAGNYEAALTANAQSLLIKADYKKAQELLKNIYPKAVKSRKDNIAKIQAREESDMWDLLVPEYQGLVNIFDTMADLPRLVHPKTKEVFRYDREDYYPQLKESRTNAAAYHYQKGVDIALQSDDPDNQKQAALEFKKAMDFDANYKDVKVRYEQARRMAVKRIAILAFEDKTGDRNRYGGIPDMLESKIVSSLINDKSAAEFMEIISRERIDTVLKEQELSASGLVDESSVAKFGQILGAHEILSGKILKVEVQPSRVSSQQLKESKTIEIEQGDAETDPNDEDDDTPALKLKQDIQVLYTTYTKEASVYITASYEIVDVTTGRIKVQDTYTGTYTWSDTWARKDSGDDRALTPAAKALIAKSEPFPPSESEMVSQAIENLSQQFIEQIKRYVK